MIQLLVTDFMGVLSRGTSRVRISDFGSMFWMEMCFDRSSHLLSQNLQLWNKIIIMVAAGY